MENRIITPVQGKEPKIYKLSSILNVDNVCAQGALVPFI